MKHFAHLSTFVFATVLGLGSLFGGAQAMEFLEPSESSGNVRLEANQQIGDNLLTAGNEVDLRGPVQGDAFLAGNNITVDDTITGNLIAAGGAITVNGHVQGDIIAAGGTVKISRDARVDGDILLAGGTLTLDGTTSGKALLGGGTVSLSGSIGKYMTVYADQLDIADGAVISGDLKGTISSSNLPNPNATLNGAVTLETEPTRYQPKPVDRIGSAITGFFMSIVAGIALLLLAPKLVDRIRAHAFEQPGKSLLAGTVTLFAAVPFLLFLAVLVITLPLAGFLALVFALLALLGGIFGNVWIADAMTKKQLSPFVALIAGTLGIVLLSQLPFIGQLIAFAAFAVGFGATALSFWQWFTREAR